MACTPAPLPICKLTKSRPKPHVPLFAGLYPKKGIGAHEDGLPPLPGWIGELGAAIRWCRFARPPATGWQASGLRVRQSEDEPNRGTGFDSASPFHGRTSRKNTLPLVVPIGIVAKLVVSELLSVAQFMPRPVSSRLVCTRVSDTRCPLAGWRAPTRNHQTNYCRRRRQETQRSATNRTSEPPDVVSYSFILNVFCRQQSLTTIHKSAFLTS